MSTARGATALVGEAIEEQHVTLVAETPVELVRHRPLLCMAIDDQPVGLLVSRRPAVGLKVCVAPLRRRVAWGCGRARHARAGSGDADGFILYTIRYASMIALEIQA